MSSPSKKEVKNHADVAERQTRWFQVPVLRDVWVQIPSSAPTKEVQPYGCAFFVYEGGGFEVGAVVNNSLNGC